MKNNGPYKIKSSEIKYKNPWIEVREDKVIHPKGKDGIFGVVKMLSGVSILAIDDKDYVYLTNGFHYAIEDSSIEVVSGAIDKNEKPIEAAKRELMEELGIEAKNWTDLGLVNPFTTTIHSCAHLFLARNLKFGKSNQTDMENIELVKVKFEKAVEMVMKSQITHGPSCVLILKAKEFLDNK